MLPDIAKEELAAALDATVAEILAATGVEGPPVDAREVARELLLTVAWDARQSGRARIVHLAGDPGGSFNGSILLRPEPRTERRHWAIAHEIGEEAAERVFRLLGVDPRAAPTATREHVANQLAGRLLLPTDWFAADGAVCDWDLFALKERYGTASHELIARRMLDFDRPVIVTVFDHGERTWRRSNVPGRIPPLNGQEQIAWRQAHQTSEPADLESHSLRVRAWPIHEVTGAITPVAGAITPAGWKREIVRTDLLEEFW